MLAVHQPLFTQPENPMKERILCNATVELIQEVPGKKWEVTVWRMPPDGTQRVYTLNALSDTLAAQNAMRMFCEEMEKLRDAPLERI